MDGEEVPHHANSSGVVVVSLVGVTGHQLNFSGSVCAIGRSRFWQRRNDLDVEEPFSLDHFARLTRIRNLLLTQGHKS